MDKPHHSYTLEELAADPDFRNWALNPSPENQAYWQGFADDYPEKASLIEEAQNLIQGVQTYFGKDATDTERLKLYFEEVRQRAEREVPQAETQAISRRFSYQRLAAVASIFLLLGVASWFWISQQNDFQTYATTFGEWKTVQLPDGSTARLNAHSELKLASNWEDGRDRKVWLKGEAFFNVEQKPTTGAKFTVIANEVAVEVLGTAFNVNSRGDKTEVFLEEGKIKLDAGKEERLMEPGDFIAFSSQKKQIVETRKGVNELHSSWKDGVLIMEEEPVHKILNKIAEIYGVEFEVKDSNLLESKTTIRIPMDKLEIALPILEKTLGKSIEHIENRLIVP